AEERQIRRFTIAQQQVRDQVDAGRAHEVGDPRAVSLAGADEPDERERLDRLPQRSAIHAEAFGPLALGRPLVADRERAAEDELPQLLNDLMGYPGAPDGAEHECLHPSTRFLAATNLRGLAQRRYTFTRFGVKTIGKAGVGRGVLGVLAVGAWA